MSGLYSTYSTTNTAESFAERARAIAAEKAAFGDSVIEKVYYGRTFGNTGSDVYICKDGSDDGKISFGEKIRNFGKGIVAPIKNIFSSPKNMIITGLTIAAGAALIVATSGAAAPVMVALGLVGGATQIGAGLYKQATATTDAQAAQAWQQMGSGTFAVGTSAIGAKSALKAAGVKNASNMTTWGAIVKCLKDTPKYFSKSMTNLSTKFPTIFPNWGKPSGNSRPVDVPSSKPRIGRKHDVIELPPPAEKPALPSGERLGLPAPKVETGNVNPNITNNPTTPEVIQLPEARRLGLPAPKVETGNVNPNIANNSTTPEVIQLPEPRRLGLPAPKAKTGSKIHTEVKTPDVIELPAEMPSSTSNPGFKGKTTENISGKLGALKSFWSMIWQKIKNSMELFGLNNNN